VPRMVAARQQSGNQGDNRQLHALSDTTGLQRIIEEPRMVKDTTSLQPGCIALHAGAIERSPLLREGVLGSG